MYGGHIDLFMWGYQEHFRGQLERTGQHRLSRLAPDLAPRALLIGILIPGKADQPVCIEPEKGDCPVSLFDCIEARILELIGTHPLQNVMYGDPPRNRDKPARLRRDAILTAVRERLQPHAATLGMMSFCGWPADVGNYSVVPVFMVSRERLYAYPRLESSRALLSANPLPASLPEAVIECALFDASKDLLEAEPGRYFKDTEDLVPVLREAGRWFMRVPSVAVQRNYVERDLFDDCNLLAELRYESTRTAGQLLIAAKEHPSVEWGVRFREPVPLRIPRWSRKVLQMAAKDFYPVTNGSVMFGLGRLTTEYDATREDAFLVSFVDSQTWELRHAGALLMRCAYGVPGLPLPVLSAEAFRANLRRVVPETTEASTACIWSIVSAARDARHGSLLVVSADAAGEAARLSRQATSIEPAAVPPEMVASLTSIDGAVLLDAEGRCHAIGVILDGLASQHGTPERGARYNSAWRYVDSRQASTLAVVISEDGMFDVIPMLPPQVRRDDVARHVNAISALLAQPDLDAMRDEVNWLGEHRFYLGQAQCEQANLLVAGFYDVCNKALVVCIQYQEFAPNPAMNESYFVAER